jgi:hypothetical protein
VERILSLQELDFDAEEGEIAESASTLSSCCKGSTVSQVAGCSVCNTESPPTAGIGGC